jgi:hypothetical protein
VTPAAPAADPPARPALVEVRFDAQPSGSVFAEGQPTELCRTPCAFDIDPGDGGPADHRVFVVKRSGYVDSAVTVDLTGSQREFRVALQRASDGPERRPTRRPAKARKDKPLPPELVRTRPSEPEPRPAPPPEARPEPTKPTAIDPADTLDPFRKK